MGAAPSGWEWVPDGELWRLPYLGVTGSRSLRRSPRPLLPSQDVGQGRPNRLRTSQHCDVKRVSACAETLLAPRLKTRPPPPSTETGSDQWRCPEWGGGDLLKQEEGPGGPRARCALGLRQAC